MTSKTVNQLKETANESKEQVNQGVEQVVLAGLGLVGMAQDERMKLWDRSEDFFMDLIKRGKQVREEGERTLRRVMRNGQNQAEKVEDEVETRINETLNRLSVPSRQDIDRLSAQLDLLIAKLDERTTVASEPMLPVADYDDLNSKHIVETVQNLPSDALVQILSYELAHANRVTVTREVERLLSNRAEAERAEAAEIAELDLA